MFLAKILKHKQALLALKKNSFTFSELQKRVKDIPPPRGFQEALSQKKPLALIAEIKRASPSAGWINKDADIWRIAKEYEWGGAAAISVLTEENFFGGSLSDLLLLKKVTTLPLLQKEFIIDPFQIYEGRALGADAVLLIVKILSQSLLRELMEITQELGMSALVEVHDEEDLEKTSDLYPPLLGINNRNLQDLSVNLETTFNLIKKIPEASQIISESGIKSRADVSRLLQAGVDGILVGEILMRSPDPKLKIRELLSL